MQIAWPCAQTRCVRSSWPPPQPTSHLQVREAIYQRALLDVEQAKQQANGSAAPDAHALLYLEGLKALHLSGPEDSAAQDREVAAHAAEFRCVMPCSKGCCGADLWHCLTPYRHAATALQQAGQALLVLEAANTWQAQLQHVDALTAQGTHTHMGDTPRRPHVDLCLRRQIRGRGRGAAGT